MKINGKTWDKWQQRAEASTVLSREQWWKLLSDDDKEFFRDLNEKMGPLQFLSARRTQDQRQ